ncbi:MAG: DUF3782 domain-containing protein [Aigarchaeota archaeon]|nr:DUF3782 domain-containing protein [Candidatus Pelearchaeum maunauluense]
MELKEDFLRLLQEGEEFRYAVAGYLGFREVLERIDRNTEAIKSLQEQVAENSRDIKVLQEEVRNLQELVRNLQGRVTGLRHCVAALGARWGILPETAFREGSRGVVERNFGGRATRWITTDREGLVHGHPSVIEIDLVVRDREHVLVEVKSSISKGDVAELQRIAQLYEKETGIKPKLAIVSPYIDEKARELAMDMGIDTHPYIGYGAGGIRNLSASF